MPTVQKQKEFSLNAIAPYYAHPEICAHISGEYPNCLYITSDGRMCVLGKHIIDPTNKETLHLHDVIGGIDQINLKHEFRRILSNFQWTILQSIHDKIAIGDEYETQRFVDILDLFTLEELKEAASKLK